ncbi:MAG: hypothetical protein VR67_02575 [Peptococcaceae bacterium BRH_c8a]|nr:MAG: hypothetical protein VR67_02575 [Peptococcaceae bacterium BRH_c8a]
MPFWEAQQSLTVVQWLARVAVIYFYLLLLAKLMGQREIGRLTLFDFIISIIIGSTAAGALSSSTSGLGGVMITVGALAVFQIILSILSLKFSRLRRVVEEEPIILVQNGKLLEQAMKKTRINLDDLMSQLRIRGYFFLGQVEFAILEPEGKISVLPKSQNRAVTPQDLGLATKYEGYPTMLIEDGNIINENLKRNNLSEKWLYEQLQNFKISSPKDVLAAMLDTQGRFYYSLKNSASERTAS